MIDLPWLHRHQQQFSEMLKRDCVPHALLIIGGKGLGKLHLAEKMAQMAMCENVSQAGACQSCSSCLLYKAGNHTDYTHICAEKATIKVEQIRSLSQNIMLSSTRNQYKVVLIQDADLMNRAAANALLKTLEEPPSKVLIILTSNEYGRLLPTITSRCMKLNVSPPSYEQVFDWLCSNNQQARQDQKLSLMLTNDSPLEALALLENNSIIIIKEMLEDLRFLTLEDKSVLEISQKWMLDERHQFLTAIASYFLALIKSQFKLNMNHEFMRIDASPMQLMIFIKQIYVYNHRVSSALKPQLLLEELLLHWKSISL